MNGSNTINAFTSSIGWTAFSTIISATTTPPTFGNIQNNTSYYLQFGKILRLKYYFYQTTNGTAGSGTYLFSIPLGFTINTLIVSSSALFPSLGSAILTGGSPTQTGLGVPYYFDNTHYAIMASASTGTNVITIGSVFYPLSVAPVSFSVSLDVPIL